MELVQVVWYHYGGTCLENSLLGTEALDLLLCELFRLGLHMHEVLGVDLALRCTKSGARVRQAVVVGHCTRDETSTHAAGVSDIASDHHARR